MAGIPEQLLNRLREALLKCEQFDSDHALRLFFRPHEQLEPWHSKLPESNSPDERVGNLIAFLLDKHRSDTGKNALVLFVSLLSERIGKADERHEQLANLASELERAIESQLKPKAKENENTLSKEIEENQSEPDKSQSAENDPQDKDNKYRDLTILFAVLLLISTLSIILSYVSLIPVESLKKCYIPIGILTELARSIIILFVTIFLLYSKVFFVNIKNYFLMSMCHQSIKQILGFLEYY